MASEQKEEQSESRTSSGHEAGVSQSADKFEDIVESLLRFLWRFVLTAVSFVLIPRSATRRSINPTQGRTYVAPLTFVAVCSALLTIIGSSVLIGLSSRFPVPAIEKSGFAQFAQIQAALQAWHLSLIELAATSIPGIAVIFLGSWAFGKIFFQQGQGRQRFQSLGCYAWGSQCIILIVALALVSCAVLWQLRLPAVHHPQISQIHADSSAWKGLAYAALGVLLYGLLAPSTMLLLGAGALYDSIGRRRVGILRYLAIGFFSLILTVIFLSAVALTAVAHNIVPQLTAPRIKTRIPYASAVVEQKSPDVVVLIAVVLNNNSDQEFLISRKDIDASIQGLPFGRVSEILDAGGGVIPVAVLRPRTTEAIQFRIVFHQINESLLTEKRKLSLYIHLKDLTGQPESLPSTDWKINLSVEGLQVLEKYTAADAMIDKRLQQRQKH